MRSTAVRNTVPQPFLTIADLAFDPTPMYTWASPLTQGIFPPMYYVWAERPHEYHLVVTDPDTPQEAFVFFDARAIGFAGTPARLGLVIRAPQDANLKQVKIIAAAPDLVLPNQKH